MDEYYTMRGINFSPRSLKFSLSHNPMIYLEMIMIDRLVELLNIGT